MRPSFENWLPNSGTLLVDVVKDNCSAPFKAYKASISAGFNSQQALCRSLFDCVISNVDETTTYLYQSASVLLGLTPTALSLIGNSTAEVSLLSSARPVLACLIAFGAPTIAPFPSFRQKNPLKDLKLQPDCVPYPQLGDAVVRYVISVVEYIIVGGAAANVAYLAYQLSTSSVFLPSCEATWHPFLWTYIAFVIHVIGVIAFNTRVHVKHKGHDGYSLCTWISSEMRLCVAHSGVIYELRPQSGWSVFLYWLMASCTSVHLLYGTLVLSSSTFIVASDAVILILRYGLSTVAARLVLMFEIYGLQRAVIDPSPATPAAGPLQRFVL